MMGVTKIALGILLVSLAGMTAGVVGAGSEEERKMVFHVDGMR